MLKVDIYSSKYGKLFLFIHNQWDTECILEANRIIEHAVETYFVIKMTVILLHIL